MAKKSPAKLTKITVSLPFGIGKFEWTEDPVERKCAWELYVELVTRVSVQRLSADQGSMREALSSLYSLFASARNILRQAGPDVAKAGVHSVGGIAIRVLNEGLRPFLSKWHIALSDWEAKRLDDGSIIDHESTWPLADAFRADLGRLREELETYADALGKIAGVKETS
jgi:hypothetical protein